MGVGYLTVSLQLVTGGQKSHCKLKKMSRVYLTKGKKYSESKTWVWLKKEAECNGVVTIAAVCKRHRMFCVVVSYCYC